MRWWMRLRWQNERWYFRLTPRFGQDLDRYGNKSEAWSWFTCTLLEYESHFGCFLTTWFGATYWFLEVYFLILQFMLMISILLKDKNEVIFFLRYSYDWLFIIQVFDFLEWTFLASTHELFTLVILLSALLPYNNMFFKYLSLSVRNVFTYLFIYLRAWFTE